LHIKDIIVFSIKSVLSQRF